MGNGFSWGRQGHIPAAESRACLNAERAASSSLCLLHCLHPLRNTDRAGRSPEWTRKTPSRAVLWPLLGGSVGAPVQGLLWV